MSESITLVGFGNMGRALAAGWVAGGRDPATITVVEQSVDALAAARTAGHGTDTGPRPDVVVFAVKPDQLEAAARAWAGRTEGVVFLSIAAGRTIGALARVLGGGAVVRAMPNTPAAIGRGVTGLAAGPGVTAAQRELCATLMAAVGLVVWVDDEAQIDAITAVSGSGPAYVFAMIEALEAAAVALGLDPDVAASLAVETVAGAGAYAAQADVDAAELRRRVTSPKGTTEAALGVLLRDDALGRLVRAAVEAAARRSRELAAED